MIAYILKVTLCWSLFYLLYHCWLGRETFFRLNRFYLIGTALLSLAIPLLEFQYFIPAREEPALVHYLQPVTIGVEQLETVIITASAEEKGFDWWTLLIRVYWLGAAVALFRFGYGLLQIRRLYRNGEKVPRQGYSFIRTEMPHVPFSFFKNLFWSRNFEVSETDRQSIIRHEEAHIKQWHSLDVILMELLGVLFWCSPLIYLYKKAMKTTHEYLADDFVLTSASRKQYGRLLLRQSQSPMPIAISNSLFSSQLKNRIVMMTKTKSTKKATLKYLAMLPLLALMLLAFSWGEPAGGGQQLDDFFSTPVLHDTIPGGEVFKVVEEMPLFPGCENAGSTAEELKNCADRKMLEFVYNGIRYPEAAKEKNIEGMVVVRFIIEKDGSISNPEVVRSIGGGCDEEVLRVVKSMPAWTPGKQRGQTVRVQYMLPVRFELDQDTPASSGEKTAAVEGDHPPLMKQCAHLEGEARTKCSSQALVEAVYSRLKYPEEAKAQKIEGMVVAKFTVMEDGSVSKAHIVRSLGGGCDEEVLRVINTLSDWIPGKKDDKAVATEMALPVKFALGGDASVKERAEGDEATGHLPRFAACDDAEDRKTCAIEKLFAFVIDNLKYPEEAKKAGVEGMVVVKFIVDKDGSIRDAHVTKGIGAGCDEEALRVVNLMPDWVPATKNGQPVPAEMALPFRFALPEKEEAAGLETFELFPNPATNDAVNVKFQTEPGNLTFRITDVSGKQLKEIPVDNYDGTEQNMRLDQLFGQQQTRSNVIVSVYRDGKLLDSKKVIMQ